MQGKDFGFANLWKSARHVNTFALLGRPPEDSKNAELTLPLP